jgi:hypothetical protein
MAVHGVGSVLMINGSYEVGLWKKKYQERLGEVS